MTYFKYFLVLLAIVVIGTNVSAQSRYRLEVEQQIADSTLLIDFYIQKVSGNDFVLGSSNFAISVSSQYLDMSRMRKVPDYAGKWDISHSRAYTSMGLGGDTYVALTIKKRTRIDEPGQPVTAARERIGRVAIPIIDFCGTNTITWITEPVAINNYELTDIKPYAEFVNPAPAFAFSEVPPVPVVQIKEDTNVVCAGKSLTLETTYQGPVQWLYEGKPIKGATTAIYQANKPGKYSVRALHCIRDMDSEPVEIFVIPEPASPSIKLINDTLVASESENYQWYFNGEPVNGATDKKLIPTASGDYKVKTKGECGEAFSEVFNYEINKTDSLKNITKLVVYPNPSLGDAVVRYNILEAGKVSIKVFNMLGELVVTLTEAYHNPGTYQLPFVATELGYGAGLYIVRMSHAGTTQTVKVIEL